ncbi:DUF5995 family protein [Salipaludibacillus sp. HK11]|uniref:DUF5995 family protein n=1 Tax=Salipaludibacillus sp. HK11 TaxID=3394320 RepID=UPI0039FDA5AB
MGISSNLVGEKQTLIHVIDIMTKRLHVLQEKNDYRQVFQRVYLLMTKEMQLRIESGFFRDPIWMERVLVKFAHYYFNANDAFESGESCSPAWDLAFRFAEEKRGFVLQDALLGINAHINSDLPFVLHNILAEDNVWPDAQLMMSRRKDHELINDVLADLIDLVQDELVRHYARLIRPIDYLMGNKDESLASFFLAHCRTKVWYDTQLMLEALDEEQRNVHRKRIENEALKFGLQVADIRPFRFTKMLAPFTRRVRWF